MALLISEKLWSFTEAAENAASIDELSTRFQNLLAPHGVTGSSIAVISKPERVITDVKAQLKTSAGCILCFLHPSFWLLFQRSF